MLHRIKLCVLFCKMIAGNGIIPEISVHKEILASPLSASPNSLSIAFNKMSFLNRVLYLGLFYVSNVFKDVEIIKKDNQ